eukprot:SAG11_NODE_28033_length_326_cov_0.682819_1_plen_78_part_01
MFLEVEFEVRILCAHDVTFHQPCQEVPSGALSADSSSVRIAYLVQITVESKESRREREGSQWWKTKGERCLNAIEAI